MDAPLPYEQRPKEVIVHQTHARDDPLGNSKQDTGLGLYKATASIQASSDSHQSDSRPPNEPEYARNLSNREKPSRVDQDNSNPPAFGTQPRISSSPQGESLIKGKKTRNKPSLSCQACTVKKTKCDRIRPICFACQKRRSDCHYSLTADLIEESHRTPGADGRKKRARVKNGDGTAGASNTSSSTTPVKNEHFNGPNPVRAGPPTPSTEYHTVASPEGNRNFGRTPSRSSTVSTPMLLSNVPFSHPTIANVFKVEHPFSNYWTRQGGLSEVIDVLPSKQQSDILVAKYFDVVDPVYPLLHRESFFQDYNNFWAMSIQDRKRVDGSLVALMFVLLAMGTQFVSMPSRREKEQSAEFYISAAHQALRVINYLGQPSIRKMQAMVLVIYFLMNDNHASDAWAFAGILTRHACSLGLNRDPSVIAPNASPIEKQQRRKLWQAVLFQDTFFSIILKLPPNATHSDCHVDGLYPEPEFSGGIDGATDISYIASMWRLANIVQPTICTPRSLDLPISYNASSRRNLVADFEHIYRSLPAPFRTFNDAAICDLAGRSKRLARQTLFLTSNYYHCLMLIHADEHENLELDVYGTLDAAHEAINSFFLLHKLFEEEARVWYHFQHRAFSEALIIAELVRNKADMLAMDPKRMRAKDDVLRMIGILGIMSDYDIVAKTRVSVLGKYL